MTEDKKADKTNIINKTVEDLLAQGIISEESTFILPFSINLAIQELEIQGRPLLNRRNRKRYIKAAGELATVVRHYGFDRISPPQSEDLIYLLSLFEMELREGNSGNKQDKPFNRFLGTLWLTLKRSEARKNSIGREKVATIATNIAREVGFTGDIPDTETLNSKFYMPTLAP